VIAYLRGKVIRVYYQQNRAYLEIDVGGLGYEIQILPRWAGQLNPGSLDADSLTPLATTEQWVFTHLQIREDQGQLFGFPDRSSRDLFRILITLNGIGSQSAMALLDTLPVPLFVEAITTGNIRLLSTAPGIGKKTAERLVLELKGRLDSWTTQDPLPLPRPSIREEVELALLPLGYTDREIMAAFRAVAQDTHIDNDPVHDVEYWLAQTLLWLSQHSGS
jgi:Holliday junction DNA helicase RuvA